MRNKVVSRGSLLLVLLMLLGLLQVSAAADLVVADLTRITSIQRCGLPASTEYKKTGSFTMKWAGADIFRDITIPADTKDLSGSKYIEMWVYSPVATKSQFTLAFLSDSTDTACTDYFYANINVNWSGWKLVSLGYGEEDNAFTSVYSPVGWNKIDEIRLWPYYGGNTPVEGTALYFDKIMAKAEKSAESEGGGSGDGDKMILADFSVKNNVVAAGFPASSEQTLSGDVSLKWAGADLKRAPNIKLPITDWSAYGVLEMDVYSEKMTGSDMKVVVISENPETEGTDYYVTSMIVDWTGWKTFSVNIGDYGSFSKNRQPLGWDQVTQFTFWPEFGGVSVDPSTVLYIDKIWLSGEPTGSDFDNTKDYILPAQSQADDVDTVALIQEKHPNQGHPRLLLTEEDFTNLKEYIKTDPYMKKSYGNVINTANAALSEAVLTYGTPDGKRLPRSAPNMMPPLAMAYKLTGDTKYKDRLWTEIEAVSAFPDWNPSHFLDVGDFARGMAFAYDWLYNDWNEAQRRTMRNALVRHGFGPSMGPLRSKTGFAGQVNNWNQVINSGVGLAALAFADEPGYKELCNEVINRTVDSLPTGIASFAPDGACPEGPGYWNYAMETFFQYDAGMHSAMGTDFGLTQLEGMNRTGYFPVTMNGPTNLSFNFADAGSGMVRNGVLFWVARLFDQPELGGFQLETGSSSGGNWADMALYRPDPRQSGFRDSMPLDNFFRGEQNVATVRSTWYDRDALFMGFKGGHNQASHCDLDIGSFVMDALGTRWIVELGSEYYEAPGMWDFGLTGGRWNYYRKRAEGNNTLVINPKAGADQNPFATADIYKFESSDAAVYGLVDMTEAYKDDVQEAKRGFALVNNRSTMIVQDEIKNTKPAEIYSFFHTAAKVTVAPDKKSAIMEQNKQKMKVTLVSPNNAELLLMDAAPLPTSPNPTENLDNSMYKKLAVHMTNAVNPTISVVFTPVKEGQPETNIPSLLRLDQWDEYKKGGARVETLTVDGIPLEGFSPYNLAYTLEDGNVGTVAATADSNMELEITQADGVGSSAFIRAKQKTTGEEVIYSVTFDERVPESLAANVDSYEIKGVAASAVPEAANVPENTFDKDFTTRWSADNQAWIAWDLGEEVPVSSVMLSFMNGSQRATIFKLEVSTDGTNYTTVFDGRSNGKTDALESFSFAPVNARYIRYNGSGNTSNEWNSITEVNIPKPTKQFNDIDGHWAQNEINYMASIGMANGVNDTQFAPEETVNRAEFISMVARADGLAEKEYAGSFSDVKAGDWFAGQVQAAWDEGMIPPEMVTDGKLQPNAPITREEMCSVIVKTYELNKNKQIPTYGLERFTDQAEISDYAKPYVEKGLSLRLIKGVEENLFAPKDSATRAQAVVMVKRLFIQIAD